MHRGSCLCGASLFWDPDGRDWTGIAMGAFDGPTNTRLGVHIFTAEQGDYYDVADNAPRFATVPPKPA